MLIFFLNLDIWSGSLLCTLKKRIQDRGQICQGVFQQHLLLKNLSKPSQDRVNLTGFPLYFNTSDLTGQEEMASRYAKAGLD